MEEEDKSGCEGNKYILLTFNGATQDRQQYQINKECRACMKSKIYNTKAGRVQSANSIINSIGCHKQGSVMTCKDLLKTRITRRFKK